MAHRSRKREPLLLEWLEPRVYLSAPDADTTQPLFDLLVRAEHVVQFQVSQNSGLPSLHTETAFPSILVLNVDADARFDRAVVATLDGNSVRLLQAVPLASGSVVIVTTAIDASDLIDLAVDGQTDSSGRPATSEPNGSTAVDRATSLSEWLLGAVTRDPTDSQNPSPQPSEVRPAPTVVILLPRSDIPDSVVDTPPPASAPTSGEESSSAARPTVRSPPLPSWFQNLSSSPFWTRAVHLSNTQARLNELLQSQLNDDSWSGSPWPSRGNLLDEMPHEESVATSRVMIRSPARLLAFTTPAKRSSQVGAEFAVYNFDTGQMTRTGHSVSGSLAATSGHIAFLTAEIEQGTDLSGDGVLHGLVLQIFDPVTGGVRNTGIHAERIKGQNGQLILGVRDSEPSKADDRAQWPSGRLQARRYDPVSGRLFNLSHAYDEALALVVATKHSDRVREENLPTLSLIARDSVRGDSPLASPISEALAAPMDAWVSRPGPATVDGAPRGPNEQAAARSPAGPPTAGGRSPSTSSSAAEAPADGGGGRD